jgi:hypothetical protein
MDPAVFDRLTSDRGWPPERFAAWFTDSALRLLTTGPGGRRPTRRGA